MRILSWSDPRYFRFLVALVRSLREHDNFQQAHLGLIDFEGREDWPDIAFSEDPNVTWEMLSSSKSDIRITNKVEFYRNFRPSFFLDQLVQHQGPILTLGANGLARRRLKIPEMDLENYDTIFLERDKPAGILSKYSGERIGCIEDLNDRLLELDIDFERIINTSVSKLVLLGTHGFSYSENSIELLERWQYLLRDAKYLNRKFSDMDLFVKAYIDMLRDGYEIKKRTYTEFKREEHPICDTHLSKGGIWFAKGPLKWNSKKYLSEINRLVPEEFE